MTRLILVHGGVHGSWCWDRVLEPLRALGHQVETLDLPGRGADADRVATVTLQDWVDRVSAQVDAGATPVTLVAHSMGGITASVVADLRPEDIARVVYVAAVVPRDGEAALPTLQKAADDSLLFAFGAMNFNAEQTVVSFGPEHVGPIFYNNSSPHDVAWATERVCPDAVVPMATPVSLGAGFARVPKTYLAARQDRAVPIALQRSMAADAGAEVIELDTDHSPFVSAVEEFVRTLDYVVSE
jgi:pimeloyl-ACP methyl ester carboxylesterase